MNDIIERLAKVIVSSQPSYSRLDMDGAYPMANQVFSVMADEIERLRKALLKIDELNDKDNAHAAIHAIVCIALGEKE